MTKALADSVITMMRNGVHVRIDEGEVKSESSEQVRYLTEPDKASRWKAEEQLDSLISNIVKKDIEYAKIQGQPKGKTRYI